MAYFLEEKFKEALKKIINSNKILIATHQRPDSDALASVCAFANFFKSLNKEYILYCEDHPTSNLYYLPGLNELSCNKKLVEENFSSCDLIISLDCGDLPRTGLQKEISARNRNQFFIEFDHHIKKDDYADLEIRNKDAISTTELLYYFFKLNKIKISKDIANCLLAGILADSGNFFFPNTSEKGVAIASELLLLGARMPRITKSTLRNKSLSAMKLWGVVLNNLQINEKYNLAISALTIEEMAGYDSSEEVFDSLSAFLSNLSGVKAIIFLKEEKDQFGNRKIKGSLRSSHPKINLFEVATRLGGGGHAKAAGFTMNGRLEKKGNSWRVI